MRPGGAEVLPWRAKVAELARECGLLYVTGGGTTGGTTLLAHLRVDVERSAELAAVPLPAGLAGPRGRGCRLRKSGARLAVASLHLPLPEPERLDHARRALDVFGPAGPRRCSPPGTSTSGRGTRPGRSSRTRGCATSAPTSGHTSRPSARPAHRRRLRHRPASRRRLRRGGRPPGGGRAATTARCWSPCECRQRERLDDGDRRRTSVAGTRAEGAVEVPATR